VTAERITIQDRINEITSFLEARRSVRFEQLFEGATSTYELVVSFLALLEMAKMRMIRIYQPDPESPIHLEYRLLDEHDVDAPTREGAEAPWTEEPSAEEPSASVAADELEMRPESDQKPDPDAEPEHEPRP
jgi:segregation and condensation protein A